MNAGAQRTLAYSWLLLIHQLPAKPAYLRVKIWRRLQDLGAVAVKNAVHALPMNEETQEDFEWLLREIVEGGGEAVVCEARTCAPWRSCAPMRSRTRSPSVAYRLLGCANASRKWFPSISSAPSVARKRRVCSEA
jgi:hypothetical protein